MKVRCKYSNYNEVIPPLDPAYTFEISHFMKKDGIYTVYGLSVLKKNGKTGYLIVDETDRPRSFASDLFEIVDSQIPIADWHIGFGNEQHVVSLIFGYEEFVKDMKHFAGVLEQETEDLERFWKWKEIIDRQDTNPEDEWEMVDASVDGVAITFKRSRRTGEYEDFQFV